MNYTMQGYYNPNLGIGDLVMSGRGESHAPHSYADILKDAGIEVVG